MAHEACEWNDQDILQASKREYNDAGTHYRFAVGLPNGEPLTSEYMDPNAVKANTLIAWCEAVRSTIAGRAAQEEEERKAKRARRKAAQADSGAASVVSKPPVPAKTASPSDTATKQTDSWDSDPHVPSNDPVEYARRNLEICTERCEKLRADGQKILTMLSKLEARRTQWASILDNLEATNADTDSNTGNGSD